MTGASGIQDGWRHAVHDGWKMPELRGVVPSGPVAMRSTYYDTADFRLARAGVSLRFRRTGERIGAGPPWTVSLPTSVSGGRLEFDRPGPSTEPPASLISLLSVHTRGEDLEPAVTLRVSRITYDVRDGGPVARVYDDRISVMDGRSVRARFRDLSVDTEPTARAKVLRRLARTIEASGAGAARTDLAPKHLKALGLSVSEAHATLARKPTVGDLLTYTLRSDMARLLVADPLVRLRVNLGDSAVRQMRVAVWRLRADLQTFAPALASKSVRHLTSELRWLGVALGAARDAEMLRDRLHETASLDPIAPLDAPSLARVDADLTVRHEDALRALDEAVGSGRYMDLIAALGDAAADPPAAKLAGRKASTVAPRLVACVINRLTLGGKDATGARDLNARSDDDSWHLIRKRVKRARYTAEAAAPVAGLPADHLAHALADVQDVLGAHRDAVFAATTWLAISAADPDDHALAVTAGRLAERERGRARESRRAYPEVWRAADRGRLTGWLR